MKNEGWRMTNDGKRMEDGTQNMNGFESRMEDKGYRMKHEG